MKKPVVKKKPVVDVAPKAKTVKPVKIAEDAEVIQYNASIAKYSWLSSFSPCLIVLQIDRQTKECLEFASAEAAFQYFKTKSVEFRNKIINCVKAKDARYQGSEKAGCPLRPDWADIKEDVMFRVQLAKFGQNIILRQRLLKLKGKKLVELSPWDKELFWGTNEKGEGANKHGKTLMRVGEELAERPITVIPMDKYL